jgi:uncharacterized membrane protein
MTFPAQAALLGAVSGMRSATPLAVLAARGRFGDSKVLRGAAIFAAAGELVGDKLPQTPSRIEPRALVVRVATGAAAGGVVGGAAGAGVGGLAAAGSSFALYHLRARLGARLPLPDAVLGGTEDVLAVGLAVAATRG